MMNIERIDERIAAVLQALAELDEEVTSQIEKGDLPESTAVVVWGSAGDECEAAISAGMFGVSVVISETDTHVTGGTMR